jgi:YegS/Rv2252/BmrU family lipid kinase
LEDGPDAAIFAVTLASAQVSRREAPAAPSAGVLRRRFLLVHNETAGVFGGRLLDTVVEALERKGALVTYADAREPGATAPRLPRLADYDAVIAAGGDGTIRALAAAVGESAIPIGVVPVGTGNVFATEIGMPRGADAIADTLMTGPAIEIEGATANGAPFFLMAGAGFDGEVVGRLDGKLKRRLGKIAYALPILRALVTKPAELKVTVDGAVKSARWVVVANARHYGGSFVIARKADVREPGLHAVLLSRPHRWGTFGQLLALAAGRLEHSGGVEILPCRHVTIEAEEGMTAPVQIDGDVWGTTPLTIEWAKARLKMIVPPHFADRRH